MTQQTVPAKSPVEDSEDEIVGEILRHREADPEVDQIVACNAGNSEEG